MSHPRSNLPEPLVLNNLDWFGGMGLLTFLRDIGAPLLTAVAWVLEFSIAARCPWGGRSLASVPAS